MIIDSKILEVSEPYKLSYTWVGGGINTTITRTLRYEDGTTYLNLEQAGFEKENQAFNGAKFGWARMGGELRWIIALPIDE